MIFITQLIYIRPGQGAIFDQFESVAIPLISKYGGRLLLRLRPDQNSIVESSIETPYEVHLVTFETEAEFARFMQDEERKQFLHLKEAAIRSAILVKGQQL